MYNRKDEYEEATRDASINTYGQKKISNKKLIVLNLFLASTLGLMGYVGFDSFSDQITFLKKTNVMGVTHTIDDQKFISMLNESEVDSINSHELQIRNAIDNIVVASSIKNDDSYFESTSKESLKKSEEQIVEITIKKGDTLASLAEEYYGDSSAYDRIIQANSNLTQKSHTIYVGQTINLPY